MEKTVTISLDSYDVKKWRNELIWMCIQDNPEMGANRLAKLLGVSYSTVKEYARQAHIDILRTRLAEDKIMKTKSVILYRDLEEISKFKK